MAGILIRHSKEVAAGTADAETYTPPANSRVWLSQFVTDAAFTTNCVVKLVWNYDHVSEPEVLIWTSKGAHDLQLNYEISESLTDGTRKLAIVLDNGEVGPVFMSGLVRGGYKQL